MNKATEKFANYCLNVMYGVTSLFWAIIVGRRIPRGERGISSDSSYAKLTLTQVKQGVMFAHSIMADNGWTTDTYRPRAVDCEDYCYKFKAEFTRYVADKFNIKNSGIPCAVFLYNRKDGVGHAVVEIIADGKDYYFESFPGFGSQGNDLNDPIPMTDAEKDSGLAIW